MAVTGTGRGLDDALQGDLIAYQLQGLTHIAYVTGVDQFALDTDLTDTPIYDPHSPLYDPARLPAKFDPLQGRYVVPSQLPYVPRSSSTLLHPTHLSIVAWDLQLDITRTH